MLGSIQIFFISTFLDTNWQYLPQFATLTFDLLAKHAPQTPTTEFHPTDNKRTKSFKNFTKKWCEALKLLKSLNKRMVRSISMGLCSFLDTIYPNLPHISLIFRRNVNIYLVCKTLETTVSVGQNCVGQTDIRPATAFSSNE